MDVRNLSGRELEVVRCTARGLSAEETGKRLFISTETVKAHRKRVIGKLRARNMTHAVAIVCMNRPDLLR